MANGSAGGVDEVQRDTEPSLRNITGQVMALLRSHRRHSERRWGYRKQLLQLITVHGIQLQRNCKTRLQHYRQTPPFFPHVFGGGKSNTADRWKRRLGFGQFESEI